MVGTLAWGHGSNGMQPTHSVTISSWQSRVLQDEEVISRWLRPRRQ